MWGTFLSEPLRIVASVGRYPADQLMRRMPIRPRRVFSTQTMRAAWIWGIRPNFSGLSPWDGQVAYVLLTSAPVAIGGIATPMMPLDLHVLSLSLAFILSQDQTLRCCIFCLVLSKKRNLLDTRTVRKAAPVRSGIRRFTVCLLPVWNPLTGGSDFPFLVSALSISSVLQTCQ